MMCLFSFRWKIVSQISLVVITFPLRCLRAYFTRSMRTSRIPILIASLIYHSSNLSSAPITYCVIRAFSFSGRMLNILPISFGFTFSSYLKCKISRTFPKKFQASCVRGFAILTLLTIFFGSLKTSSSGSLSGSSELITAYCFSVWTLSLITISPDIVGQSMFPRERRERRLLNSASKSHSSHSNSISYFSKALKLLNICVVNIARSSLSSSI